jgi:hypothetical protein
MFSFLLVGIVLFGFFRSGGVPTLLPSARRYRTADQFRVQRHISPDKSGNRRSGFWPISTFPVTALIVHYTTPTFR